MNFAIKWHPKALDDLDGLEKIDRERIIRKIKAIESEPLHFVQRLEGYELFKLRVGDHRVILELDQKERIMLIYLIDHRSKVYQELQRRTR